MSIEYLKSWRHAQDHTRPPRAYEDLTDEDVVEDVIEMLGSAIEYRCGYIGRWGYGKLTNNHLHDDDEIRSAAKATFCTGAKIRWRMRLSILWYI